ncbi:lipopolysaccharide assembly protein LapA domain-containing protein [Roseibium algae]|uniref:Lipopolysaccharide assembly protein LapA domain-containing protein n=1 Tax=Roseibium algae TaxID=3123038 RepID=A0ABU8TM19_9HYPH
MTRFIKNAILIAVAIILVPLSVANRHTVSLALNPFDPQDPRLTIQDVPLFWVIFACIGVGIVLGGIGAWAKQGKWRKEARENRKEANHLRHLQEKNQADTSLPALSKRTAA